MSPADVNQKNCPKKFGLYASIIYVSWIRFAKFADSVKLGQIWAKRIWPNSFFPEFGFAFGKPNYSVKFGFGKKEFQKSEFVQD